MSELDCKSKDCFSEERTIQKEQKITFSEDNESVFFTVQQSKVFNEDDESAVQVWNTADKQIYPGAKVINGWTNSAVQVMWTPRNDQLLEINQYIICWRALVLCHSFHHQ